MIKKIRALILGIRNYNDLERDFVALYQVSERRKQVIDEKTVIIKGLRAKASDPMFVVKAITDDQFQFFNYSELKGDLAKKYYLQAQQLLEMDVFVNEVSMLNKEWMTWTTKQSRDFEGVLAMRHQISGLNMLKQRLESIEDPEDKKIVVKKPHANI